MTSLFAARSIKVHVRRHILSFSPLLTVRHGSIHGSERDGRRGSCRHSYGHTRPSAGRRRRPSSPGIPHHRLLLLTPTGLHHAPYHTLSPLRPSFLSNVRPPLLPSLIVHSWPYFETRRLVLYPRTHSSLPVHWPSPASPRSLPHSKRRNTNIDRTTQTHTPAYLSSHETPHHAIDGPDHSSRPAP